MEKIKKAMKTEWIIVIVSVVIIIVAGVVLAIVFTLPSSTPAPTITITLPTVTPSPTVINTFLLENSSNQCFELNKLSPQLNTVNANCTAGNYWVLTETTTANESSVTFVSPNLYQYCLQKPFNTNVPVYAGNTGCNGIEIRNNNIIVAPVILGQVSANDLCITLVGANLQWGNCSSPYLFSLQSSAQK